MAEAHKQESEFNEATLKMQRIGAAQEIINELRTNLLAWNPAYLKYNYEVVISNLVSLCYEVFPSMTEGEREEFALLRKIIDDTIANRPIREKTKVSTFSGSETNTRLNKENWDILRNAMFKFEDFARQQVDSHGFSNPKKKDAGKAAVDM